MCFRDTSKVWISVGRCVPVNVLREINYLGPKGDPDPVQHMDLYGSMCWKSVSEIVPSGTLIYLWKITTLSGNIHYKWPCSIAILNYQRVKSVVSRPYIP